MYGIIQNKKGYPGVRRYKETGDRNVIKKETNKF
jgi:hypothetical protein